MWPARDSGLSPRQAATRSASGKNVPSASRASITPSVYRTRRSSSSKPNVSTPQSPLGATSSPSGSAGSSGSSVRIAPRCTSRSGGWPQFTIPATARSSYTSTTRAVTNDSAASPSSTAVCVQFQRTALPMWAAMPGSVRWR